MQRLRQAGSRLVKLLGSRLLSRQKGREAALSASLVHTIPSVIVIFPVASVIVISSYAPEAFDNAIK